MNIDNINERMQHHSRLVCGVASGMAKQFNWSCFWTRVVWAGAIVLMPGVSLVIYFALALLVKEW